MNPNIYGDFQICIRIPLNNFLNPFLSQCSLSVPHKTWVNLIYLLIAFNFQIKKPGGYQEVIRVYHKCDQFEF